MLTSWQDVLTVTLNADEAATSAGLYCANAESLEFEATLLSGSGSIVGMTVLHDPALTEDAGPFLWGSNAQATAADLATKTDTAALSFAEIVGADLSTSPRSGRVLFLNRAGDATLQGNCPYQWAYCQITVDGAAVDAEIRIRARVKYPGAGGILTNRALGGITV